MTLLRDGLVHSPYNFKLKLLLLLLYYELGDFSSAWKLWGTMNIRHIQLDTLLYLSLPAAIELGEKNHTAKHLCRLYCRCECRYIRDWNKCVLQVV